MMNRKDRIAVVVSIFYFILYFLFTLGSASSKPSIIITSQLILSLPVLVYWAYRFIKSDISFLKMKDD